MKKKKNCNSRSGGSSDEVNSWHLPCERWEPLYKKKSMSVPMNKWWADEDCSSSCPICTLMKPLKWLKLSGKSELWVWSRLQQKLLFGLLNYAGLWGVVIFPVCYHKRLQLILHWIWVKLCIAEHTVFLFLRWSTRALSQFDFHWNYSFLGMPLSSN